MPILRQPHSHIPLKSAKMAANIEGEAPKTFLHQFDISKQIICNFFDTILREHSVLVTPISHFWAQNGKCYRTVRLSGFEADSDQ